MSWETMFGGFGRTEERKRHRDGLMDGKWKDGLRRQLEQVSNVNGYACLIIRNFGKNEGENRIFISLSRGGVEGIFETMPSPERSPVIASCSIRRQFRKKRGFRGLFLEEITPDPAGVEGGA
jgi:hypothetical protein